MRRIKSFLLILIALWLPVQTAAALAMPFCGHAGEPSAQAMVADSPAPCHEHVVPAADPASGAGVSDLGCDNCEMCHLASAGYLPSAAVSLPVLVASGFVTKQVLASISHIAELPQQPPRRLN